MASPAERPSAPIRAPRGTAISCKGWPQEAALRMLMNNLDPDVAERWEDLVVYGGSGKAARSWQAYHTIVETLRRLEGDETLLVQSGKPVGVFRTHPDAPRVLIANALLVPAWADWEHFRRYDAMGLTMYGQMTAGSWIYIGTQGILQGTYETFGACARKHFGGSLAGRLVLSAGLGGMGGAQPLAVTLNGGVGLFVEVDRERIERRLRLRYVDRVASSLDEALAWANAARARGEPLSIAVHGNAADVHPELARRGVRFDVVTDQTSAHDVIDGYVPAGLSPADASALRARDPKAYLKRAYESIAAQMRAMLELQRAGAILFDYGNNFRREAENAGVSDFSYPGFVPAFIRPLFCEGMGPFRWVALSGDPEDIYATDRALIEAMPENESTGALARSRARARQLSGAAGAHLLARLRRPREGREDLQRARRPRDGEGAHRHRPRPSRLRLGRLAESRDGIDARRLGRDRRLAGSQRAPQHRVGRNVGVGAPRRRRRHRVFDPRRHGRRRRRHAGSGATPRAGAHDRPGYGNHAACRRGLPGGRRGGAAPRDRSAGDHDVRLVPDLVLTEAGWASGLGVTLDGGRIVSIEPLHGGAPDDVRLARRALVPGTINAHCHTFQSLLRGLGDDLDFAGWRDRVLYPFSERLDRERDRARRRLRLRRDAAERRHDLRGLLLPAGRRATRTPRR